MDTNKLERAKTTFNCIVDKAVEEYNNLKEQGKQYEAYKFIETWLDKINSEKAIEISIETLEWVLEHFEELSKAPVRKDISGLCSELMHNIQNYDTNEHNKNAEG